MPAKYEAIRDNLMSKGVPEKEAKSRAAAIYNSQRKQGQAPVTGSHRKQMKERLKAGHKPKSRR
jgi:hypothetical protein